MDSSFYGLLLVPLVCLLSLVGSGDSVVCSDPGIPVHGSRKPSSQGPFQAGTTLRFSCDPSYTLEPAGGKKLFCEKNGQWNGKAPQCVATECSQDPPVVPHTHPVVGEIAHAVGSAVKYTCVEGYRAVGSAELVCGKDGNWDGNVTCEVVTCGNPVPLSNGNVTFKSTTFSSIATYSCKKGFVFRESLSSTFSIRCQSNGYWPSLNHRCVRTCPDIPKPDHGNVSFSNWRRTAGSTATFSCAYNYKLRGSQVVMCTQRGNWQSISKCEIFGCGSLGRIDNVRVTYNCCIAEPQVYTSVTFSCNQGHELIGLKSRVCLPSGKWSGAKNPVCKEIFCASPEKIPESSFTPVRTSYRYGTEVTYKCNANYYLFRVSGASATRKCKVKPDGTAYWDGLPLKCVTLAGFEEDCKTKGWKTVLVGPEHIPYCEEPTNQPATSLSRRNQDLDTLTIVTASAGSTLGALVILLSVLICLKKLARRRRIRHHSSRGRHYSDDERIAFIATYTGDVHFILPSYDEAMSQVQRSPPPFESVVPAGAERLTNTNNNEATANEGPSEGVREGPNVVGAFDNPLYEPSSDSERRINIVSNPLVDGEAVNAAHAEVPTAGVENDGLSRSESLQSETDSESGDSESRPLIGQADRGVMV